MMTYWRLEPGATFDPGRLAQLRPNHGIVLSYLDESTKNAEIVALGIVRGVYGDQVSVAWRKVNVTLEPTPWGIPKWRTMPVFKFPKDRAEAYRLRQHFGRAFSRTEVKRCFA